MSKKRIRTVEYDPGYGWIARNPSTGEEVLSDFRWTSRTVARTVVFEAKLLSQAKAEIELEQKRRDEQRTAAAQAFHAVAYLSMPEDLKSRAAAWGVSAIMEAVWMNAFECGYKQSIRDVDAGRSSLAEEERKP